ncbi:MAG TPA: thermonuclease family protein [Polyangia bacterium]
MTRVLLLAACAAAWAGCDGGGGGSACGPTSGRISNVVDGDTVDLATGERIRYLLVNTPETHGTVECYGPEAAAFNTDLVLDQDVTLEYDVECKDRYGRLLAYVTLTGGPMVNRVLLERGYARILQVPPNGDKYIDEFNELERQARSAGAGLWGACP